MLTIPSERGFASFLSEMWSLFLRIGSGLAFDGHRVYRFLTANKSKTSGETFSLFIAFDLLHCTKTAKPGIESIGGKTICWYAT